MWTKLAFENLVEKLPIDIDVVWDKAPSFDKYGHVNCLLAALIALSRVGGTFTDFEGHELKSIIIQPLRRKLTDKKKRWFSIVGLNEYTPAWVCTLNDLVIEVYFNYHFFYEAETTGRQYYPSASTILRCRNFLHWNYVSSPGSWGSDIAHLTFDWDGTYILEAGANGVKKTIRKNFKGYKFLPSKFKYFVSSKRPQKTELEFICNNGFEVLVCDPDGPQQEEPIIDTIHQFLDEQFQR